MRTLVISDIHSNHLALQAVLDDANGRYRPTEIYFLGDLVGYMPSPLLVWQTLQAESIPVGGWLAGNHDWGLVGKLQGPAKFFEGDSTVEISHFREIAWTILLQHRTLLQSKQGLLAHIDSLPVLSQPRGGIYLAHGAFKSGNGKQASAEASVTQYWMGPIFETPEILVDKFMSIAETEPGAVYNGSELSPPRMFIFGHTHKPGLWRWKESRWNALNLSIPQPLGNLVQTPLCFNPGSVGQPRDGYGCPSYVVIDWDNDCLHFHRVRYPVKLMRQQMQELPYRPLLEEPNFLIDPIC